MHERAREFVKRVEETYGFTPAVKEFSEGTKTAADAADAIGCAVEQIASSLAFEADDSLVVVITSGANHVHEPTIADHLDATTVRMAAPDDVKATLGWSIGGVPPFLHETAVPRFIDETLLEYETVWAAAGTPTAVFPIAPDDLLALTDAEPVAVED